MPKARTEAYPERINESRLPLQGSGGVPGKEECFRSHRRRNVSYLSNKHCEGEREYKNMSRRKCTSAAGSFQGVPSVPAAQGSQTAKLQQMRFLWEQCQVIQEAVTVSHMCSGSVSGCPAIWQQLSTQRHSEGEAAVPRDS